MTGSVVGLVVANVLYFGIGVGLLPLLRLAEGWEDVARRLPLAYLVGIAATGILAAHLALIEVAVGLAELIVLALVVLAWGWRRARRAGGASNSLLQASEPAWSVWGGAAAFVFCAVLLVHALRTYAVRPLLEWDGWAIWGTKARALYEFGGATGPAFTSDAYLPLQHPLFLPALEAMGFRAMAAPDTTLVHVQLALLAVAFLAAFASLLRGIAPEVITGAVALAVLAAEPVLKQLSTNMADVPLALFVAAGLVGVGRWLATAESWSLTAGAVFLGAASITKSEGAAFALLALAAAAPAARGRLRPLGVAAGGVLLVLLPWRLNVALRDLPIVEYRFGDALSPSYLDAHADRLGPAVRGLGGEIFTLEWGLLPLVFAVALMAAVAARRYALATFAALWAVSSFALLVVVYWISSIPIELALVWSADRTIISIVVGAAAVSALLAGEAWRVSPGAAPGKR